MDVTTLHKLGIVTTLEGEPIMTETRKPDYFFFPESGEEAEICLEVVSRGAAANEDEVRSDLDLEAFRTLWRPDDAFE
jgi:hypothetical protein